MRKRSPRRRSRLQNASHAGDAMIAYMVAWTHLGKRELIDCDSQLLAGTIAVLLRESGREDVSVMEVPYEPDPEMAQRVWARIQARIAAEGVEMAVFR